MKRFLIILVIFAGVLVAGCEEDPISNPTAVVSPTLAMFPLGVGSTWTYKVTDSLAATERTVTVRIDTQTVAGANGAAYRWLAEDGGSIDTISVTVDFDTLLLEPPQTEPIGFRMRYNFPFVVGDAWEGFATDDTVRVLDRGALNMPTLDFENAFRIEWLATNPNSALAITHWFVPNVGPARIQVREFFLGVTRNETWELIAYRVL